jgi:vacuolar-type H+-ATPase subunit I/STV1
MPEKVTREEKQVEIAILKAKEIIQEAKHLGILELDEPSLGEDFKVKRPKKNPAEVPIPKTSNIEGKEKKENDGKLKKAMTILKAVKVLNDAIAKKYGINTKVTDPTETNPVWEQEGGAPDFEEGHIDEKEMQSIVDEIGNAMDTLQNNVKELQNSGQMDSQIAAEIDAHHKTLSRWAQDLKESTMGASATPTQQS